MERDSFACFACGDVSSPLTVHHKRYTGRYPWAASSDDLQTLCESCHESLGRHPKGGIYYARKEFSRGDDFLLVVYEHCPSCGNCADISHSGLVLFSCGHNFYPEPKGMSVYCQTWHSGFPAIALDGAWLPMNNRRKSHGR